MLASPTDSAGLGRSTHFDDAAMPPARELWQHFRTEKADPRGFSEVVARTALVHLDGRLDGARVLDLGCGDGEASRLMAEHGATLVAGDLDHDNARSARAFVPAATIDGRRLPFPDASFDGVYCSNVLEHTPEPERIVAEMARLVRPGGWGYLSWTPWYSPWGGHAVAPLHYLGPRLGTRAYVKLFGAPRGPNVPLEQLWPTTVGTILRVVDDHDDLERLDACPRYYPRQRWMMRVPGIREVLSWNAAIFFHRR